MRKFILSFHTHFEAITALKVARHNKTLNNVKLIAVPRKISSSCGTALLLSAKDIKEFSHLKYDRAFECLDGEEFIEAK